MLTFKSLSEATRALPPWPAAGDSNRLYSHRVNGGAKLRSSEVASLSGVLASSGFQSQFGLARHHWVAGIFFFLLQVSTNGREIIVKSRRVGFPYLAYFVHDGI